MKRSAGTVFLILAGLLLWRSAEAQSDDPLSDPGHFDVIIGVTSAAAPGGRIVVDTEGRFPLDASTRTPIVPTTLVVVEFLGPPIATYGTDDPGWVVRSGQLAGGETLRFRALGRLAYYDPTKETWGHEVPNGERVRFFGAIPPEVLLEGSSEDLAFYLQGTSWTVDGLEGPEESAIEVAAADGSIHSHLDFCLEDGEGDCTQSGIGAQGTPAQGAYLIEMQFWLDEEVGGVPKYLDSTPLQVALNNGMPLPEFQAAVRKRIAVAQDGDADEPVPGAGVLILSTQ